MKKVLILADVEGWAYDIIARNIIAYSSAFEYTLAYEFDIINDLADIDYNDYDLVFCFYWANIPKYGPLKIKNFSLEKTAVGIHSFNSWQKREMSPEDVLNYCQHYAGIGVPCIKLQETFDNQVTLTRSGYDPDSFYKVPLPEGKLKFLWCGNVEKANHGDVKGYHDIIKPVFEGRSDVELITQTRDDLIANNEMIDFYRKGHVLVCASANEGGPLPVIEAMACGRPVISTKVGIPLEVIREKRNGIFIERNIQSLDSAIDFFLERRNRLALMSKYANKDIQTRRWDYIVKDYEDFFRNSIRNMR